MNLVDELLPQNINEPYKQLEFDTKKIVKLLNEKSSKMILLEGEFGVGKTSMLEKIQKDSDKTMKFIRISGLSYNTKAVTKSTDPADQNNVRENSTNKINLQKYLIEQLVQHIEGHSYLKSLYFHSMKNDVTVWIYIVTAAMLMFMSIFTLLVPKQTLKKVYPWYHESLNNAAIVLIIAMLSVATVFLLFYSFRVIILKRQVDLSNKLVTKGTRFNTFYSDILYKIIQKLHKKNKNIVLVLEDLDRTCEQEEIIALAEQLKHVVKSLNYSGKNKKNLNVIFVSSKAVFIHENSKQDNQQVNIDLKLFDYIYDVYSNFSPFTLVKLFEEITEHTGVSISRVFLYKVCKYIDGYRGFKNIRNKIIFFFDYYVDSSHMIENKKEMFQYIFKDTTYTFDMEYLIFTLVLKDYNYDLYTKLVKNSLRGISGTYEDQYYNDFHEYFSPKILRYTGKKSQLSDTDVEYYENYIIDNKENLISPIYDDPEVLADLVLVHFSEIGEKKYDFQFIYYNETYSDEIQNYNKNHSDKLSDLIIAKFANDFISIMAIEKKSTIAIDEKEDKVLEILRSKLSGDNVSEYLFLVSISKFYSNKDIFNNKIEELFITINSNKDETTKLMNNYKYYSNYIDIIYTINKLLKEDETTIINKMIDNVLTEDIVNYKNDSKLTIEIYNEQLKTERINCSSEYYYYNRIIFKEDEFIQKAIEVFKENEMKFKDQQNNLFIYEYKEMIEYFIRELSRKSSEIFLESNILKKIDILLKRFGAKEIIEKPSELIKVINQIIAKIDHERALIESSATRLGITIDLNREVAQQKENLVSYFRKESKMTLSEYLEGNGIDIYSYEGETSHEQIYVGNDLDYIQNSDLRIEHPEIESLVEKYFYLETELGFLINIDDKIDDLNEERLHPFDEDDWKFEEERMRKLEQRIPEQQLAI